MDVKKNMFLTALKAALKNEKVSWSEELESQDWVELFRIATTHQVLPLIYEAVYPVCNNDKSRVGTDRKQLPKSPVRYRFSRLSDYGMRRHLCGFGKQHDYSG